MDQTGCDSEPTLLQARWLVYHSEKNQQWPRDGDPSFRVLLVQGLGEAKLHLDLERPTRLQSAAAREEFEQRFVAYDLQPAALCLST